MSGLVGGSNIGIILVLFILLVIIACSCGVFGGDHVGGVGTGYGGGHVGGVGSGHGKSY